MEFDNGKRLTCEVAQGQDESILMEALATTKWSFDAAQYEPPKEQQFALEIKAQVSHQKMEPILECRAAFSDIRGDTFGHSPLAHMTPPK